MNFYRDQNNKPRGTVKSFRQVGNEESAPDRYVHSARNLQDSDQENQNIENQESNNKEQELSVEQLHLQHLEKQGIVMQGLGYSIHNLEQSITKLQKTIKDLQPAEEPPAEVYRTKDGECSCTRNFRNYYDIVNTIKTAGPVDPQDFDSSVYNSEKVYQSLDRYAEIIHIANDGTDDLFVIVSHLSGGQSVFSSETVIRPGEVKTYNNVYELRLRSPTAGLQYRVTEYNLWALTSTNIIPTEVATLHNVALPVAGTDILSTDITPTNTPTTLRIQIAVSIAGTLSAAITNGGNTQVVNFNAVAGPDLIADGVFTFELLLNTGDTVNFRYSTTGGTIRILRVHEIGSSIA